MTVQEAIELLSTFPKDAILIQTMCSDYRVLEEDDFSLMKNVGSSNIDSEYTKKLVNHNGHIMWVSKYWMERNKDWEELEPITAVHITGN
ncbi:hypothetical protein C4577_04900 [Candidatus Parcubacteria bacterium]|nr:MAG: hypothetical protein C4577_04900 [Candidatus Parcubacteria bacterium]